MGVTPPSTWPWVDHPASGLLNATERPVQTRFRFGFTCNGLTLPRRVSRRLIKQKARGQAPPPVKVADRPSTACKHTVSGTVSLPSPGFFSPFPHGTSSLSVASECLALEDGPPRFPRDCTCPAVLGNCLQEDRTRFVYRTITFSGWPFQAPSTAYRFCDFPGYP